MSIPAVAQKLNEADCRTMWRITLGDGRVYIAKTFPESQLVYIENLDGRPIHGNSIDGDVRQAIEATNELAKLRALCADFEERYRMALDVIDSRPKGKCDALRARCLALETAYAEALEFIADYADVSDGPDGEQVPNRAMDFVMNHRTR